MNRLILAFQLFRCALLHGMIERRAGYRCLTCSPVRKRKRAVKAEVQP